MKFLELPKRAFGEFRVKGRKGPRSGLYQNDTSRRRIDVAKVLPQGEACEFGNCPAISTPVGPAPTITKVNACLRSSSAWPFQRLRRPEHAAPDLESIFNALNRALFPFVAEVMMARPRRHNEIVIFESQVLRNHLAALWIDLFNLVENDSDVRLIAKNAADRLSDIRRRQLGSGYLVEEGLEKMVIAPVNQDDLDRSVGQRLRRSEPSKSPPMMTTTGRLAFSFEAETVGRLAFSSKRKQ